MLPFAEIMVGYAQSSESFLEGGGVARLTVAITMPIGADTVETTFSLLVDTSDRTATGLEFKD